MQTKILVAVNGSESSKIAAEYAAGLAKADGRELITLYVVDERRATKDLEKFRGQEDSIRMKWEGVIKESVSWLWNDGVRYSSHVEVGDPVEKILEVANKEGVGMIVLGYGRLKGISRIKALASASRTVVESSKIPVLLVPAG